jgi:release factor glutamine methyltransferase
VATELGVGTRTTVTAALADAADILAQGRCLQDPEVEARELLASLLDAPRHWPLLHREATLAPEAREALQRAARKRAGGAPIAYATGRASFRHLVLAVDERVLIPRPETEMLVDLVLENRRHGLAADACTGSGCVALALAQEGSFEKVFGTDVSLDALDVAARNAERLAPMLRAPVELVPGSLLAPLRRHFGRLGVVAANPPYIAEAEAASLPTSVRNWEPPLALYSPEAGMAHIRALVREAADALADDGLLVVEVDARRASLAAEIAATDGRYRDVAVRLDLAGRERFLLARRTPRS